MMDCGESGSGARHEKTMFRKILCAPCFIVSLVVFSAVVIAFVAYADILLSDGEYGRPQIRLLGRLLRIVITYSWIVGVKIIMFLKSVYDAFR